jgi:acyl-CoA reductase-like NAD-dependent aldehyde dehydrogenase
MCAAAVARALRLLRRSVRDIGRFGRPRLAGQMTRGGDGRRVVRVFPHDLSDRVVYRGLEGGYLRVVYGGAEEGSYLTGHASVDAVHLTGSAATYETIAFGAGADGERRKRMRQPLLAKPCTAELGNVSPVIVVPGAWSHRDMWDMAEQIATWFVGNAGFACLAPRMLVQHARWPHRRALLEALTSVLDRVPTRPAWYPGARATHERFVSAHPSARTCGSPPPGHLPWTLISDVDPSDAEDICFTDEPFCAVMSETALDADDPTAFLAEAVRFANATLWGSLCATLIVHPSLARDPMLAHAVEEAVADLRYGTVTVNVPTFAAYYLLATPWGAYPGHEPWDAQSGLGRSTNVQMLDGVAKSVVRGPYRKRFDPIRVTSTRVHLVARALAYAEADWTPAALARLAWVAR